MPVEPKNQRKVNEHKNIFVTPAQPEPPLVTYTGGQGPSVTGFLSLGESSDPITK